LAQKRPVDEIIVVDSSDSKEEINALKLEYSSCGIVWIDSEASVCLQRNMGVRAATGNWILLADDDIEFNADYLEQLEKYAMQNADCGALAGRLLEFEENKWTDQHVIKSFPDLLWRFIFQLHIWGDIQSVSSSVFARPFLFFIRKFYASRGNGFSLAGWPVITNWAGSAMQTAVYSLGANLIRKTWLLQSPYDETLDSSGIGDNYGVALGFPGRYPIHVLASTFAYHHRADENRLDPETGYYRRILALHYFIKRNKKKFSFATIPFFMWSLVGKYIFFLAKGNHKMLRITLNVIGLIASRRNPYIVGHLKKVRGAVSK
jgi:glycosyltransferase involved in cell wall biosynthesis